MITVEIRNLHYHADTWFVRGMEARLRGARIVQQDGDAVVFPWPGSDLNPVVAALREGRHVIVNANAISTWESFQGIVNAVAPGRRLGIMNPGRFLPSRLLIRQQLDAGKLGKPGLIRGHTWVTDNTQLGLAPIDETLWYFGMLPTVVFAHRIEAGHDQIHLGFNGGGMALLTLARTSGWAGYSSLSLIGSTGAAYDDNQMNMHVQHGHGFPLAVASRHDEVIWAGLVQAFVDGSSDQQNSSRTIEAWRQVLIVNNAIEQSITTGDAVPLAGGPFHG